MARVHNNPVLQGVRGRIGDFIIKQYSYGPVITTRPYVRKLRRGELSELQVLKRKNFADAVAYAKSIVRDREKKAAYAKKLPKGKQVYQAAIKEFMKKKRKEERGSE